MTKDRRCHVDPVQGAARPDDLVGMDTLHLGVVGMGCPACAQRVRNALMRVSGVVEACVGLQDSVVQVWHQPGSLVPQDLVSAVVRSGEGTHHRYLAVPLPSRFLTSLQPRKMRT